MNSKHLSWVWNAFVIGGVAVAGIKYLSGSGFLQAIEGFHWAYLPFLLLLSTAYLLVKAWRFSYQLNQTEEADDLTVMRGYVAAQSGTLVPGGIVARVGILSQANVGVEAASAALLLFSLSDQVILISSSIVAALWFENARQPVLILMSVLVFISILLGIENIRSTLGDGVEKLLDRFNLLERWARFVDCLKESVTPRVIIISLLATIVAFALLVETLHLCALGLSIQMPYLTLVLAVVLPSLLGRISALPGGVGVTEAGMIGILNTAPGITLEEAAAIVVVYRVSTLVYGALVGSLVFWLGWSGKAERAAP